MSDLTELFTQVETVFNAAGEPVAPLSSLPSLIERFEARRGVQLLSPDEHAQLAEFARGNEMLVGVSDLLDILAVVGPPASPSRPHPPPDNRLDSLTRSSSSSSSLDATAMLSPQSAAPSDGSPVPRTRTLSSLSSISSTSELGSPRRKKHSLFSAMHFSPSSSMSSPSGELDQDLTSAVVQLRGTYLGVPLDGPLGEGWSAVAEVEKLGAAAKGIGTLEKDIIAVIAQATYPRIYSIDKTYSSKHGKNLLELFASEASIRGNVRAVLDGLVMGPLKWDVFLLHKALDSRGLKNDTLLIDLMIGRSPADLSVLRAAYARRYGNSKHRLLEDAVLAAYSGMANQKLRKALQVALEGKWVDADLGDASDPRLALLNQDVDQLKVALRPDGNTEIAVRIVLARSPTYLNSVQVEFLKKTHISLTRAIKRHTSGTLEKVLLHALNMSKKDHNQPGVYLEAKLLYATMEGAGTRNEALGWRLVRAHWDRSRFKLIQQAFERKYRKTLAHCVIGDTSGTYRDLLKAIIATADLPEPEPTAEDVERLESRSSRSRTSSVSSSVGSPFPLEDATLEATGELPPPLSPRSPPPPLDDEGDATPHVSSFPQFGHLPHHDEEPTESFADIPKSVSPPNLAASTSSNSSSDSVPFAKSHRASSSLSYRQRSSPLDTSLHRPPSSAGGSLNRSLDKAPGSVSSMRHNKPVAPSRRRRTSEDMRAGSEEPNSPNTWGDRSNTNSPTPNSSSGDRALSPAELLPRLTPSHSVRESSNSPIANMSTETTSTPISSPPSDPLASLDGSPVSSIDTTSYHAPPISPVGDVGPSSTLPSVTPGSYSLDDFPPLVASAVDFFSGNDSSPEKAASQFLRRENSTASTSSGESRPGSMFLGEGFESSGSLFRPDSINFGRTGGRPGSTASGPEYQFQLLFRHANELARKLKESEARLETSASAYEEEHSELEARLEETRVELQVRRREEKELRSSERQHLSQITSLESDISKLTKSLERSRDQYETMKRNYQDQCTETEKLRTLINETRLENRAAEEAAQQHNLQVQQFERDREILQAAISKLEGDLALARRAQESLDDQKQENLLLKETIDRLRFDMDELRSVGRKSMFLDGTGSTTSVDRPGGPSVPSSMSKSLGLELARRLKKIEDPAASGTDKNVVESKEAGEVDEEVDHIVVTTHRRVMKRTVRTVGADPVVPSVTHIEETTTVADAETQTFSAAMIEMNVQTDLSAIAVELTAPSGEPLATINTESKTKRERQEELARGLGIDLTRLDEFVTFHKPSDQVPHLAPALTKTLVDPGIFARRAGRWTSRVATRMNVAAQAPSYFISVLPPSARPYVAQFLESQSSLVFYSISIFLFGVISGAAFLPLTHHHHVPATAPFHVLISPYDRANWHQFNNFATHWGEGLGGTVTSGGLRDTFLYWMHEVVWGGMNVVRRVPV